MLGCYDFCGYYENTFQWLEARGGESLLKAYWEEAISKDSQLHARDLIISEGLAGMKKYWGVTLQEESPELGFSLHSTERLVRLDIQDCPSKGFLLRNGLKQYADYCDHCIGWIGPMMKDAGFVTDHEHNHCGQCWWEFRPASDDAAASPPGQFEVGDVRLMENWPSEQMDRFHRETSSGDKSPDSAKL